MYTDNFRWLEKVIVDDEEIKSVFALIDEPDRVNFKIRNEDDTVSDWLTLLKAEHDIKMELGGK